MNKNSAIYLFSILAFFAFFSYGCQSGSTILENDSTYLEFNEDLSGIKSFTDKKTGWDYALPADSVLYKLRLGENYTTGEIVTTSMATNRKARKIEAGIELSFTHEGENPLDVICTITADSEASGLNWSIKIINKSEKVLSAIEYPLLSCKKIPVANGEMAGVLYPFLEGVLLTGMNNEKAAFKHFYPGQLSAQLMYFYNKDGGLYYASHDGAGYKKALSVKNINGGVSLSQEYLLPIEFAAEVELPYPVVTAFAEGRWESGAAIYREWSRGQEWCKTKFKDREDIADWLKSPNLFINYSYITPPFTTPQKANEIIKNYHDFFKMPIIATGFGWEKNEIWIGPDYFPPIHGDNYYKELSSIVKERGDHLHVFTSGFRWAIKKPIYHPDGTMTFTAYDGTEDFKNRGTVMATIDHKGEMILDKREWAHNYFLCVGSKEGKDLMYDNYNHLVEIGIDGVDLDQNLGGEVDDCFNEKHGHPIGAGLWQYKAMKEFFTTARANGKAISQDMFMGIEEPIEIFIPQLDAFHGRSYTDTQWPVMGPGGVIIPLFIYLYHPYQMGYSGWIDNGFSALGDVKYGLGRSFIFGMYPGVRTTDSYNQTTGMYDATGGSKGKFDLTTKGYLSDEMKTLKSYTELMKSYPEFLVHGEMLREANVDGCDTISYVPAKRLKLPVTWPEVQGILWQSDSGEDVAYALANLSDQEYSDLKLPFETGTAEKAEIIYYDYESGQLIKQEINPNAEGQLIFAMKPWQICLLRQYK